MQRRFTLCAVLLFLLVAACQRENPARRDLPPAEPTTAADTSSAAPLEATTKVDRYVVWAPAGLPEDAEEVLRRAPGVRRATAVIAGLHWANSFEVDGETQKFPSGTAVPVEVAYVEPRPLAAFIDPRNSTDYLHRRPSGSLGIPAGTFSRIRGANDNYMTMNLQDTSETLSLGRALPDPMTLGFEVLLEAPAPEGWGHRFVLVEAEDRPALRSAASSLMNGEKFRIRSSVETPFLRYADAVTPHMYFKEYFEEFAARRDNGALTIDPAWVKRNIVTERVPVLGEVTCHRNFIPRLRTALRRALEMGLQSAIDPSDYAGCFNARTIGGDPAGRLSAHAWGAAVDLNASANPFGNEPVIDQRLVTVITDAGMNWGGEWLNPDGMHFEWAR